MLRKNQPDTGTPGPELKRFEPIRPKGGLFAFNLWYLFALGACSSYGGMGSSSNESDAAVGVGVPDEGVSAAEKPSADLSLTGRAINGYLINALVFEDINRDGFLSLGEAASMTDVDGVFSFTDAISGLLIAKPLSRLTSIEKQYASETFLKAGILSPDLAVTYYLKDDGAVSIFNSELRVENSPTGGSINLTPMTTFVSALTSSGEYSVEAAETKSYELFGENSQFDYIASKESSDVAVSTNATNAQRHAVAYSNFLGTTLSAFTDVESADALLKTISISTLETFETLKKNSFADIKINDLLASEKDIREIWYDVSSELGFDVNVNFLNQKINALIDLNESLRSPESPVYLINDTGKSGVDNVTKSSELAVRENWDLEFFVSTDILALGSLGAEHVWISDLVDIVINPGMNVIYYRYKNSEDILGNLIINYDNLSPQNKIAKVDDIFNVSPQLYFLNDGLIYLSDWQKPNLNDYKNEQTDYFEFQIIDKSDVSHEKELFEGDWLSFINIDRSVELDGYNAFLYVRLLDLAGNSSDYLEFDIILDNLAPTELLDSVAVISENTGIYDNDSYSNNLELSTFQDYYENLSDYENTKVVHQWLKANEEWNTIDFFTENPNPSEDGEYRLLVKQVDRAGNESSVSMFQFTLDSLAPSAPSPFDFSPINERSALLYQGAYVNTFDEWIQYKYTRGDMGVNNGDWLNINYTQDGLYDLAVRRVDRAGNASDEIIFENILIDNQSVLLDSDYRFNGDSKSELYDFSFSVIKDLNLMDISVQRLESINWLDRQLHRVDITLIPTGANGISSLPIGFDFVEDPADRYLIDISNNDMPWISGDLQIGNLFQFSPEDSFDQIVFGGYESDRIENIAAGDIFIGQGGTDIAIYRPNEKILGLTIADGSDFSFLTSQTIDYPSYLTSIPTFKIYSEKKSDSNEAGISIIQSDIIEYFDEFNQRQSFLINWWENLNAWVIELNSSDSDFYFGGEGVHVFGGKGNDNLRGGGGDDFLIAGSSFSDGVDSISGFDGRDVLIGGDYLYGSKSAYILDGGEGDDLLVAGSGYADLTGGGGSDTFFISPLSFSETFLQVVINDFDPLRDKLSFDSLNMSSILGGIFVDRVNNSVQIDLNDLYGDIDFLYGSFITMTGFDTAELLPEHVVDGWFTDSANVEFSWSDLNTESLAL